MITLPIPLSRRDLGAYLAQRWRLPESRLGAFVLRTRDSRHAGVIVRRSRLGVHVVPTVVSPLAVVLCALGIGLIAWALVWRSHANKLAGLLARQMARDFRGLKEI